MSPLAVTLAALLLAASSSGSALPAAPQAQQAVSESPIPPATLRQVERALDALIAIEDPSTPGEWPYEGAMRHDGAIPLGWRAGGTGYIVAALAGMPAARFATKRRPVIERGIDFLAEAIRDTGLSENIHPGFDMRLWGLICGARGLLAARAAGIRGSHSDEELVALIDEVLRRLAALEIPRNGGWSYNRPSGRLLPAPAYSYVTAEVLQVFFEAKRQGFEVDAALVERSLDVLEAMREDTGAFTYRGLAGGQDPAAMAGSAGRAALCETVLYQAGRTDLVHVRGALDAFFTHWERLDERRGRTDLHVPPYGIAPYYFLYAHVQAAHAIELLPMRDRREYRARLSERLLSVREEESGLWNDRVYRRSAGYGTAAAMRALTAPLWQPAARWESARADSSGAEGGAGSK